MKKTRIIRALKKYDSEDLKKHTLCRFEDEKGKSYFLGEEKMYFKKITDSINLILHKVFEVLDDDKLKEKILKELKNDKK
tara:strand:- start:442 stop:681 length:240 start_codon:yes stop_codon:yes gene_type:complete